jgi:hypothetical protein
MRSPTGACNATVLDFTQKSKVTGAEGSRGGQLLLVRDRSDQRRFIAGRAARRRRAFSMPEFGPIKARLKAGPRRSVSMQAVEIARL